MSEGKCVNPKCGNKAETRGMCGTCYAWALKLVKERKTSWAELEAQGHAIPRRRAPSTAKEWLLGIVKRKNKK